jgi:hypothetical protein
LTHILSQVDLDFLSGQVESIIPLFFLNRTSPGYLSTKGDHFRFGSVFNYKKQPNRFFFFEKKHRNRTETESNRPVSVRSGSVLDFKKPRKPICSYFFSNSSVRYLFTTIVFPALCKRIKSKKSTPLISSQIQNSAINQNPKFPGTGNLDFHISH